MGSAYSRSAPLKIILDGRKLSSEYVPVYLPHREEEVRTTLASLQQVIKGAKAIVEPVIYSGPTGTGKTAVAKRILLTLKEQSSAGKLPKLATSYVNAYELRTKYAVFRKIGEDVGLRFPRKGFSTHEVISYTLQTLDRVGANLFVVLDEADTLVKQEGGEDVLYTLTRIRETYSDVNIGVGLLVIFRNFTVSIENISNSGVRSSLSSRVIKFNPYTASQLSEILWYRVEKEGAIRPDAVSKEVVDMIANTFGYEDGRGWGDARMALKTLYYAALRAESNNRGIILPEDVREVLSQGILPTPYDEEEIHRLRLHEKLLLLAITNLLLLNRERAYVSMGEVEFEYEDLCNEYNVKPLKHTSIWEEIQMLASRGLIDTRVGSRGGKGRTTQIFMSPAPEAEELGINRVPLEVLQKILVEAIEKELKGAQAR